MLNEAFSIDRRQKHSVTSGYLNVCLRAYSQRNLGHRWSEGSLGGWSLTASLTDRAGLLLYPQRTWCCFRALTITSAQYPQSRQGDEIVSILSMCLDLNNPIHVFNMAQKTSHLLLSLTTYFSFGIKRKTQKIKICLVLVQREVYSQY